MTNIQPDGYLSLPKTGKGPGILVLHAWWGLNPFFQNTCRRLARAGFVAFAPDLYQGQVATTIPEADRLSNQLTQKQVQVSMHDAIAYLQGMKAVTSSSLSVIGFSLGANIALGVSCERPIDISAVVCFYGTRDTDYTAARATYLCHFAEFDEYEPASNIQRFEQRLLAAKRPVKFCTYQGTGHWFFEKDRVEAYNAKAARLAWQRTMKFLRTIAA